MSQQLPQILIIFNRRKTASLTKKAPLEIRVSYDYKQKYISTGIMLYANQWKNGRIVNCPDIFQISQILDVLIGNIRQVLIDMLQEGEIDIFSIPNRLKRKSEGSITFLQFCRQRIQVRKYGCGKIRQRKYDYFLEYLSKWGQIREFSDITEKKIIEFDKHIAKGELKAYTKWHNYHALLKSFIKDAIDAGYIRINPYSKVTIDQGERNGGSNNYLTPSEFRQLKRAIMPTESLAKIRDVFIFQTYTCLRFSDLQSFDCRNIVVINDTKVYKCMQKKTKKLATIPLLKPALDILEKYNNSLPIISNAKYNLYLKTIAQAAGIDRPISTHWARHTGATILLNEGVDLKVVSKICGHSTTRITEQVYAKLLDETIVSAVADLNI